VFHKRQSEIDRFTLRDRRIGATPARKPVVFRA